MWDLAFAVRFVLGKSMAALMPGHSMKRMKNSDCTSSILDLERQPKKPYMNLHLYNSCIYVLKNRYTREETLRKDVLDVDW